VTAFYKLCIKARLKSGNLTGKSCYPSTTHTMPRSFPVPAPLDGSASADDSSTLLHAGTAEVKVNLSSLAVDTWHYTAAIPPSQTAAGMALASCFALPRSLLKTMVTN